jgi:hypothetical protein
MPELIGRYWQAQGGGPCNRALCARYLRRLANGKRRRPLAFYRLAAFADTLRINSRRQAVINFC